jgi:penicillin-binding protein 1A
MNISTFKTLFHLKISNLKHKKYLKIGLYSISGVILLLIIIFTGVCLGWFGYMPKLEELDNPQQNLASEVYSADGKILGTFYIENRNNTEYNEFPPYLVNALVAREDHRFYNHSGVDGWGLARVLFKTIILGKRNEGGGSTITQQLARSLFPRDTSEFGSNIFITAITKFKEWVIAIRLERKYSKEEIIALYLNSVAFSSEVYGIKAASRVYFNKTPDSLKMEEAALLVGVLKGITMYNPIRNPNRSFNRRNSVLKKMYEHQYISKAEFDSLKNIPLKLNYKPQTYKSGLATYMREYLRFIMNREEPDPGDYSSPKVYSTDSTLWTNDPLYGWCNKNRKPDGSKYNLYKDGLKIYTTIDSRMQQYAEEALTGHLANSLQPGFFKAKKWKENAPFANNLPKDFVKERLQWAMKKSDRYRSLKSSGYSEKEIMENFRQKTNVQVFTWKGVRDTFLSPWDSIRYSKFYLRAGFLAVDPATGQIKAYVGGPDIRYFKYDGVMMQKRQVGSTIKPFIYAAALGNGYNPCSKVLNAEVTFPLPNGTCYTPHNDDSTEYDNQMVTLRWGLAHSVNNVVANIFQQMMYTPVIDLLRKHGITSEIPEVPSICLGTPEFTMYELVGAYTVFPGKGIYSKPYFVTHIEDKYGKGISVFTGQQTEVMNQHTAYTMTQMLKGVVTSGTASRIRYMYGLYNDIGGKTGTTQNHSDGWFVGITPDLVAAAWVGGDEPSIHFDYMNQGQGAVMALPIYATFMKKVYADASISMNKGPFERPEGYTEPTDCEMGGRDYMERSDIKETF